MTKLFGRTLREIPSEAEIASHQLLLRAGFMQQLAAGIFSYLPLGRRALNKIEAIMRQEIESIGGQEITMPVVQPAEIWQESGRWYTIGDEMGRFVDRSGRDMVLAMTHEEVIGDLIRKQVHSYRQLPILLYHIQTKWRDDPRPRAGLIRVREFTMKDSYSLDRDLEGLDKQYRAHYQAYSNIFHRCGLDIIAVKSDVGMMGGKLAHEFIYLSPIGEDTIMICDQCGYAANQQIARFLKETDATEELLPIEIVPTPGCKTIEDLANFLKVPKSKTAKAVLLMASIPNSGETSTPKHLSVQDQFVFAIVRGDLELSEAKLAHILQASALRPATEDEIRDAGAVPGYASPIDLENVLVVVDDSIPGSANLVAGANKEGYHLRNVNYGRDFEAEVVADIAAAQDGNPCPDCGNPMHAQRGVEVGNIFKLGTFYSEAFGAYFQDENGDSHPVVMGSYGIGSGRLLACIAEEYHDEYGLKWPISIAPYQVHLIRLSGRKKNQNKQINIVDISHSQETTEEIAENLYAQLQAKGIEVLYDDRNESPGVKFNDADLIGIPIRLTVSQRALKQGGIEFKRRDEKERRIIPLDDLITSVLNEIKTLQEEIEATIVPVEYQELTRSD